MTTISNEEKEVPKEKVDKEKKCGIIMPIADTNGYPKGHWTDVLNILCEAMNKTMFQPQLVSEDDAIGLIHDRIVTNIYNNEIVICDVSSKNPNVMFELGMRLAFDKPTIIIKDNATDYSFDTGGIEHLPYPSSLRFHDIVLFQSALIEKVEATYTRSLEEPKYSPFLKSFGRTLKPSKMTPTEITEGNYILDELAKINRELLVLRKLYTDSSNLYYNGLVNLSSRRYDNKHIERMSKLYDIISSSGKDCEFVK